MRKMLSFVRLAAIALPLSVMALAGSSGSASAQNAASAGTQQPGFFERLFPSQPAAPQTPVATAAETASQTPADGGSFNPNRGGLIDSMHGAQAQGCSGTLCDLFGSRAPVTPNGTAGQAAQPRPVAAGTGSQGPADSTSFNDGRGGLIDAMHGVPVQGCGGTLCDLFGGGSHDAPVAPPVSTSAPPDETAPARTVRSARMRDEDEPVARKKPECTAPANDPWRCYRR